MEKFNHIELNNEVTKRGDNGFFRLEKDQEAIAEFLREVDYKTVKFSSEIKRLRYLVEENYYYNIFDKYIEDEIVECLELAANYKFEFKSYMAASKFYKDYALKTNDKKQYLENYNQHVFIVAMYLADGNVSLAKELMISMLATCSTSDSNFLKLWKKSSWRISILFLIRSRGFTKFYKLH